MTKLSFEELELRREERRRRRKKIKRIIQIVLVVTLVITGFLGFSKTFCGLTDLAIEGVENCDVGLIQQGVLNGRFNDNAMFIFLDLLVERPEKPEFVEKIRVKMSGLHALTAEVTEKELYFYCKNIDGKYVYCDKSGKVAQISERLVGEVIPVDGIAFEEEVEGELITIPDRELRLLLNVLDFMDDSNLDVQACHFDRKNYLTVDFKDYDMKIGNDTLLFDKLSRLEYILPSIEGMTGTLHLENFNNDSKDIAFEKDEAQMEKEKNFVAN